MFLRIDKLGFELPETTKYDPTAAAAVQELLGGRFGEMSTLNNYLHQSVAMKAKKQLGPFYELVASITAEEVGHVELVAATINALLDQAPDDKDPEDYPFEDKTTPRQPSPSPTTTRSPTRIGRSHRRIRPETKLFTIDCRPKPIPTESAPATMAIRSRLRPR